MLISVIVPLYKGKKYIESIIHNIESNVNLDCSKTEIIFVNDYPGDFFEQTDYKSRVNVVFLNHKQNKGIHKTKVDGFLMSKGEYVLFLDQDDMLKNNYFDSQIKKIGCYDAIFCNGYHRSGEPIYSANIMKADGYDLNNYITFGYPLISLGQILIRREAVPKGWLENFINNNGWDDHFFWVCLMHEKYPVVYNDDYLYVHEEAGNNASFNWDSMKNSGKEFKEKVIQLKILPGYFEGKFIATIEKRILKYDNYIKLDNLLSHVNQEKVSEYLYRNSMCEIAVYGIGVYGKKFCQMIDPGKICIKYGIDRNARKKTAAFPIYEKEKDDIPVDCIICATGFDDENVKEQLKYKAITLKEILLAIQ